MIYVAGSLNMDLRIESPYMPVAGETITGSNFITNGGGKGANQATAAAKLGGKVKMCGVVGNDAFGDTLLANLKNAGADVSHVRKENGVSTGIAMIIVTENNNRIILDKGANACLTKEDIDEFLKDAGEGDVYLTQLENPIEIVGYGLKKAKEKGLYTVLNPAPANKCIAAYFPYVDLITPNESELALFGGKEALFAAGIHKIVTTLGAKGYEIAEKDGAKTYPCIKVKAIDTTRREIRCAAGFARIFRKEKPWKKRALSEARRQASHAREWGRNSRCRHAKKWKITVECFWRNVISPVYYFSILASDGGAKIRGVTVRYEDKTRRKTTFFASGFYTGYKFFL